MNTFELELEAGKFLKTLWRLIPHDGLLSESGRAISCQTLAMTCSPIDVRGSMKNEISLSDRSASTGSDL